MELPSFLAGPGMLAQTRARLSEPALGQKTNDMCYKVLISKTHVYQRLLTCFFPCVNEGMASGQAFPKGECQAACTPCACCLGSRRKELAAPLLSITGISGFGLFWHCCATAQVVCQHLFICCLSLFLLIHDSTCQSGFQRGPPNQTCL